MPTDLPSDTQSKGMTINRPSTIQAGAWSALDVVLRFGVQFAVSVVLARLLAPEDFGIIALMTFFTSLAIALLQSGLGVVLVQRAEISHEEESAVFWWTLFASLLLGLALVAAGPAIAAFFGHPVLAPLASLAAAPLVLASLGTIQTALLTRQMRFDVLAKTGLAAAITSGVFGIAAAALGAGVWALALQWTLSAAVGSISLWFVCDWRPLAHFRLATLRGLFGFGAWVSVGTVIDVLYTQGFGLLIGKLHGVRDLGFYNRAAGTQLLPTTILASIVGRVSLSLFSSKQDDPEALQRGLRLTIAALMMINLPIMAGLILLPDLVILVLFGEVWLPAAPILSILAVGGILLPLHVINMQMVLARADSATFMRNEIAKKSIGVACVVVGSLFGIVGLAWSQVVYCVLGLVINARPTGKALGYGLIRQMRDLRGIAFATLTMAVAVFLLRGVLSTPPLVTLVLCTVAGALVYAAVGWFGGFRVFREASEILVREFAGKRLSRDEIS